MVHSWLETALPSDHQSIEEKDMHILAIVQAQMDVISGLGYWFDMREFSMEGG